MQKDCKLNILDFYFFFDYTSKLCGESESVFGTWKFWSLTGFPDVSNGQYGLSTGKIVCQQRKILCQAQKEWRMVPDWSYSHHLTTVSACLLLIVVYLIYKTCCSHFAYKGYIIFLFVNAFTANIQRLVMHLCLDYKYCSDICTIFN